MNVEDLQSMSRIALIIAIVLLLTAVLLFFLFRIPELIAELTGRAEKKFIAEAQKKNQTADEEEHVTSSFSESLISSSLVSQELNPSGFKSTTTKLAPNATETTVLHSSAMMPQTAQTTAVSAVNSQPSPPAGFFIIEEFSFTGSTEIIE